jgi:hypothetical protein
MAGTIIDDIDVSERGAQFFIIVEQAPFDVNLLFIQAADYTAWTNEKAHRVASQYENLS